MSATEPGQPAAPPPAAPPPPRRGGLGWLWLLLLLVAAVILILLLVRACDGDDDNDASRNGGGQTTQVGSGGGSLDAEGDDILVVSNDSIARFEGRDVDASQVEIQRVAGDIGFWVGPSAERRVFVEVESDEEGAEAEYAEGDVVSFTGTIEKNIPAEDYGLTGADAALYDRHGYHVRVQAEDLEVE